jgi:hypothetical protein
MFERYSFEDPGDDTHRIDVGSLGYLAAGLTGSLYVLWKAGLPGFVAALLPHLVVSGTVVAATGVTSLVLPGIQQLIVLVVAIPALLTIQSVLMVEIIRKIYQRRGWIIDASV